MQPVEVFPHYDHPISRWGIAVRINDPWSPGAYFLYRLPEWFSFSDRVYLLQPAGDARWPEIQPEAEPEWSIDPCHRKTDYHLRFYDRLELSVAVSAGSDWIDIRYTILNGTETTGAPKTSSCLMLWNSSAFVDRRHERTFIWVKGKTVSVRALTPTPEEMRRWSWVNISVGKEVQRPPMGKSTSWWVNEVADHGLIAVKSSIGDCWLGLGWTKAERIMARSTIPCLHSEPAYPRIHAGQRVTVRGRIYFHEGELELLAARFRSDVEDEMAAIIES